MTNKLYKGCSEMLHPIGLLAYLSVLRSQKVLKIKINISETYRTQDRQNELYAQGRTKPGNIVTWTKQSRHTSRSALDCYPIRNGRISKQKSDYDTIDEIFTNRGFINGSSFGDDGHHEIYTNTFPIDDKYLIFAFFVWVKDNTKLRKKYHFKLNGKWGISKNKVWKKLCKKHNIKGAKFCDTWVAEILSKEQPTEWERLYNGK